MRNMLRLVSAAAVCAAVIAAPSSASAASGPVYVGDQFRERLQAPKRLHLWASDALSRLTWDGWGRPTARARGVISTHEYGKYTTHPARVVVSRIRTCDGRRTYTRLRYTFQGQWHTATRHQCRFAGA